MSSGKFVWFEYGANDASAGVAFYGSVVGWQSVTEQMDMGPYHLFLVGEAPVAGVMELPAEAKSQGVPPHWLGYVSTGDVDGTVERAKSLGGGVNQPAFDVPGVGRIAVLHDPQGAAFAIMHATDAPRLPNQTADGEFSWSELATADLKSGGDFYKALFGWKTIESMDMGDGSVYEMFGYEDEDAPRGGMFAKPDEMPVSAWVHYANVPDLEAAIERAKQSDGAVLNGPMDVPGGIVAHIQDPQGGVFALHQAV